MRKIIGLFFILMPIIAFSQLLPVKYDHTDRVSAMTLVSEKNIIATGGDDGAVIIRELDSYRIISRIQTGYLPIKKITVNPKWPILAIVQSDNIDAFHLSVWNYETGEKIYNYRLQSKPLFIMYSPLGGYLIYSTTRVNSLTILDHTTGMRKSWLTNTNSVITALILSKDEKKAATYSPSGYIRIFNIKTGEMIQEIICLPNLENPTFIANGAILCASSRDEIVAIDGSSGKVKNRSKIQGVIKMADNTKPGKILLYCYQDGYTFIYSWNFLAKNSKPINIDSNRDFSDIDSILYHHDKILCGTITGDIIEYSADGSFQTISNIKLQPWSGIDLTENKLALISAKKILFLQMDKLSSGLNSTDFNESDIAIGNPLKLKSGICHTKDNGYLIYNTEGTKGFVFFIDSKTKQAKKVAETKAALIRIKKTTEGYLGIDHSGNSFLLTFNDFKKKFTYSSFGTRDISPITNSKLITGRSKNSLFNSSLVIVDSETGETVPLETTDLITFDLCYNNNLLSLYTIGIEKRGSRMRTVLKVYRGENFERVETLAAIPGEDHKATLIFDPYTSKLFTTLGTVGIRIIQWGGFTTNQFSGHIPAQLAVNKDFLLALNQDGSISAWHKNRGKAAFSVYQFPNDSWVSIQDGKAPKKDSLWVDYIAQNQ